MTFISVLFYNDSKGEEGGVLSLHAESDREGVGVRDGTLGSLGVQMKVAQPLSLSRTHSCSIRGSCQEVIMVDKISQFVVRIQTSIFVASVAFLSGTCISIPLPPKLDIKVMLTIQK